MIFSISIGFLLIALGACDDDDPTPITISSLFGEEFTLHIDQQVIVGDNDSDDEISIILKDIQDWRCALPSTCFQADFAVAESEIILIGQDTLNSKICIGPGCSQLCTSGCPDDLSFGFYSFGFVDQTFILSFIRIEPTPKNLENFLDPKTITYRVDKN